MSREIKFRIWVKPFHSFLKEYFNSVVLGVRTVGVFNSLHSLPPLPEDSQVIQQYTGLKDKNGVEIYEGDIMLRFVENIFDPKDDHKYPQHLKVEFSHGMFKLGSYTMSIAERFEVLGNIYENPELLES